MEYVPKHTTENHFLMVKSWLFVMFVMVFVVEPIKIFWVLLFFFFIFFYSGIMAAVCHMTCMRDPPPPLTSAPSKIMNAWCPWHYNTKLFVK